MPKVTFTGINETPYWLHKIDVILMRIDNEHKIIKSVKCKKVSKEHDLWEATVTLATSKLRGNSVFKSTSGIKYAVKDAVQNGDLNEGFERAHALKGVLSNVSLTTLAAPISEITEELRARNDIDYSDLLNRIDEELKKYRALL